jgi:hypothetical protein
VDEWETHETGHACYLHAVCVFGIFATGVSVHNGFLRGEEYLHLDAGTQRGYEMGIVDGMLLAPLFGAPATWDGTKIEPLANCITGMTDTQVAAIISKFLRDHPERWNQNLHVVVFSAFKQACPQN